MWACKEKEEEKSDLENAYALYVAYVQSSGDTPVSYEEWLAAIGERGEQGEKGEQGEQGEQGAQGVGIKSAYWTENGELILVLTDGKKLNVGKMPMPEHIHTYGEWQDMTATCQSHWQTRSCTDCGDIQLQQAKLLDHDMKNGECRYCDASVTETYNGDYGYRYLGTMENGEAMQAFYAQLDEAATAFHTSNADATDGEVATIEYPATLSTEEMIAVWKTYVDDKPLYYWLSNEASYTVTDFTLLCNEAYADGAVRAEQNEKIYSKIDEYLDLVKGEESTYNIALAFHDEIIENISYAYDANGKPSNERWAHNVLGVFEEQSGVCEAYARAYQLLLNAKGVENILVHGIANGEGHAWNMVRLEDGEWYYCDLTWDDTPSWTWGLRHNYFCVAETQNVLWTDGEVGSDGKGYFADSHTPDTPENMGVEFLYGLPKVAEKPFASEKVRVLRQPFTVGKYIYTVVGYHRVQFIYGGDGNIVIPETVAFNGDDYTVISVGGVYEDGRLACYVPAIGEATTVFIPQTVRFLWDDAFESGTLRSIEVDKDNPYFTSLDGVLFTKSLYTLITYPNLSERTEYAIPDQTVRLAYQAFDYYGAYPSKLERLTFGKGLKGIGFANWGSGYLDAPPTGIYGGSTIGGDFATMIRMMAGEKKIIVVEENESYYADDLGIYNKAKTHLHYLFDTSITTYEVPATLESMASRIFDEMENLHTITVEQGNERYFAQGGVLYSGYASGYVYLEFAPRALEGVVTVAEGTWYINSEAFMSCVNITEVILPSSLKGIYSSAFYNCRSLKRIVIPDSVTVILGSAFNGCTALEEVVLGKGVEKIESYAFQMCTSLTSIVIPQSVQQLGWSVFTYCQALTVYCEAEAQPDGWKSEWGQSSVKEVVWGYKPE